MVRAGTSLIVDRELSTVGFRFLELSIHHDESLVRVRFVEVIEDESMDVCGVGNGIKPFSGVNFINPFSSIADALPCSVLSVLR